MGLNRFRNILLSKLDTEKDGHSFGVIVKRLEGLRIAKRQAHTECHRRGWPH